MKNEVLSLLKNLIEKPSITPDDQGCQPLIAKRLEALGFHATHLRFEDVDNLWITHGKGAPLFVFAGHTDVVPPGPSVDWATDPFIPTEKNGYLFGRGAADMKSGLAAMIVAAEHFVKQHPDHPGTLAFLITSNEEGDPSNGTVKVITHLKNSNVQIDYCIVGEASSTERLGDTIKHGRRGSLCGKLNIKGKQGHVAYPQLADNAIHKSLSALTELTQTCWDKGSDDFPPTSFQLSDLHAGTGADNVIPGNCEVNFNLRYSTAVTTHELKERITAILNKHQLDYDITWRESGLPFLTAPGKLIDATLNAVKEITGIAAVLSTAGGTSDGRFIAPTGAQVVEIGPCNATIHKANECIFIADLAPLSRIYLEILKNILVAQK